MSIGQTGITVFRTGGGGNRLLETGQTTCYAINDDGDVQAGADKRYTVIATAGNTDIQVAHYAGNQISFTAPGTIADGNNGLAAWAVNDRMLIKGSTSNDGEVTVTNTAGAPNTLTISAAVNEAAGAMISLYKVAAHSNNVVTDDKTGLMWSRYDTTGEAVGPNSNGTLNWYDAADRCAIYNVANTVSVIMPGNIFRITGGAALTQFHEGDLIECAGFANAVNGLPGFYVQSATVNGADLDITVDPGNQTMIAEGAVGDTIYLVCQSIFNYMAGARLGSLSTYDDWRVPNITELFSITDFTMALGGPPVAEFPAYSSISMSSTTRPDDGTRFQHAWWGRAWFYSQTKTSNYYVFLVRLGV